MRKLSACLAALFLSSLVVGCGFGSGGSGSGGTTTAGAPAGSLEITMLYGSEKKVWIEDVVKRFNDQQTKSSSGKSIYVTATAVGSAESMNQILDGRAQPTIWSPASGVLIPVANERWGKANSGAKLVEGTPVPLVLSPVVIAMWEPMAKTLGWPQKPIGWADLAELASSGKTWADFGHPEWGPFQLGHTHPDYSNSGIVSILAMAYAATGKTRDLTVADVQKPETAAFIRKVESGVIHYGESTGFFADQMFNRGPAYLSAAVMYENLVVQSRDKTRYPNMSTNVVAVYPKEGTFWSDHPFAILNAPWVDAEKRAASDAFRDFLLARPQQELALKYGFRPGDPNVPIGDPITTANGVDPTQPQTLLNVPSAEVIDAVRGVWGQNKKRVDVMAVLDVSGSMSEENRMEQAKSALKTFVGQLADDDGFGLTTFSNTSAVLSPVAPIGPKRQPMLDTISGLFPQGGTRLYDTVAEAYAPVKAEPAGERIRAIIVLTDGEDNQSTSSIDDLVKAIGQDEEGRSVKVFTIGFGAGANMDVLKRIAEASGAKSYKPDDKTTIEQVYRDIATFF